MKKKLFSVLLCATMVCTMLTGCGGSKSSDGSANDAAGASDEVIALKVWAAEEDQNLTKELIEGFKATNADKTFDITIGVESEGTAKDTVLVDPEAAADVFAFASDQITDLVKANVLQPVQDVETITNDNVEGAITAATVNDTLYAYPMSADNGFFLYYDSNVVSEEDAKSWDTILQACADAGKKAGMVMSSGWYNAGFFYGAGFTTSLNADGSTLMDWNSTSPSGIKGTDVVQSMLDIARHEAFMPITDGDTANQIATGTLGVIISGTWDSIAVKEAFGDGYAATVLPSFTCAGQQVPMASSAGFKMIGVNANSKQVGWAMELAKYLTNESSQQKRFEQREIGPSNKVVGESEAVQQNIALAAVTAQNSSNGVVQMVGGTYWDPTKSFGEIIAQGNPDDVELQTLLDNVVAAVAQPVQ